MRSLNCGAKPAKARRALCRLRSGNILDFDLEQLVDGVAETLHLTLTERPAPHSGVIVCECMRPTRYNFICSPRPASRHQLALAGGAAPSTDEGEHDPCRYLFDLRVSSNGQAEGMAGGIDQNADTDSGQSNRG